MSKIEFFKDDLLTVRFDGFFSMVAPNLPEGSKPEEAIPQWGSFGFFGDSPNHNTFYPGLEKEDIEPKGDDFITPTYRLLSEVIVTKYGVPIDFSTPGVLKKALNLAKGITVFPDHEFSNVANSLGVVTNVYWQESYSDKGVKVPAGINAVMKLDAKSNPRIARGILMSPPSIHSSSVTVSFKKVKSHPEMDDNTFYDKAGTYDDRGNLVRFIATDVVSFMELSLVTMGADPFAQKIEDNKIVNPERTRSTYKFSFSGKSVPINWSKLDTFTISNNQNDDDMQISELIESLGIGSPEVTDEATLKAFLGNLQAHATELAALKALDENLSAEGLTTLISNQIPEGSVVIDTETNSFLESLKEIGDIEAIKVKMSMGDTHLENVRTEAINFLKLASGEEVDETVLSSIRGADLESATGFLKLYKGMVEKNLPLTCQDCRSTNVSRASSELPGTSKNKSYQKDIKDTFKKVRRKPSSIHG